MAKTCFLLIFFLGYFCILHAFNNYLEENIVTKIPYKGILVSVWQRNAIFYLLPLGFMEKHSIRYLDVSKNELRFDIVLTNMELKLAAVNYLRKFTGECIQIENIQMMPIKNICVNLKSKRGDFIGLNQSWNRTIVSNLETLKMKIPCQANPQACSLLKVVLGGDPLLKLIFKVTGNQFKIPVTKVESLNSTGDVIMPKLVKCKSEERVFRESLIATMKEIMKSVQGSLVETMQKIMKSVQGPVVATMQEIRKSVQGISKAVNITILTYKEKIACGFRNSKILQGKPELKSRLIKMLSGAEEMVNGKCWKKCFTASENDFSAKAFHFFCDDKGPTVTLLKVGDKISGGFTDLNWEGKVTGVYVRSKNSFLFLLNENIKMMSTKKPQYAIYNSLGHAPTFGGGNDLHISERCHVKGTYHRSYSTLGDSYKLPSDYDGGANSLLTGSPTFLCDEYEVYYLV